MNIKNLYITAGVLAILALIVSFLKNSSSAPLLDERVGTNLVDETALRDTAKLVVDADGQTLTFNQNLEAKQWTLEEKHDLPVSPSRISELVDAVVEAKLQRFVSENPEKIATYGFEASPQIRFLGSDGSEIVSLDLGKKTENGRQFVRYAGEEKAFLSTTTFNVNSGLDSWLEKSLVAFEADEVTSIEATLQSGESIAVQRDNGDSDWTSDALPEGKILNQRSVGQIASRFAGLSFSATADTDDANVLAAKENSHRFALGLSDGRSYAFTIGRQPEVTIEKQVEKEGENGETTTETEEEVVTPEGPVYFFIEAGDASDPINGYMAQSAFEASSYQYTSLPDTLDALLSDAPEPAEEVPPAPLVTAPEEN
ncbi:MAG: hypothetical protein CBD18_00505 [Opitutales bacterium TMED158]|nr:MAG: hypothetical protein CBD18_00505 [Opitutales bacterium TMED158]